MITENPSELQTFASLKSRFLAGLLDAFILLIPSCLVHFSMPFFGSLFSLALWFFYAPIFESSKIQATPGKSILGIYVANLQGQRPSIQEATLRNLLKIFSGMIFCLGYFFALFSEKKQTIHDLLAQTVVYTGKKNYPLEQAWVENIRNIFNYGSNNSISSPSSRSISDELEKLEGLRNRGILTNEEFEKEKKRILS